jgi:hypothetical protein
MLVQKREATHQVAPARPAPSAGWAARRGSSGSDGRRMGWTSFGLGSHLLCDGQRADGHQVGGTGTLPAGRIVCLRADTLNRRRHGAWVCRCGRGWWLGMVPAHPTEKGKPLTGRVNALGRISGMLGAWRRPKIRQRHRPGEDGSHVQRG